MQARELQLDELTEREIEITSLLADGLTNQQIADRTGLTLYTVKWYLKQIYSKLQVSNRTQAAKKAQQLGILAKPNIRTTGTFQIPQAATRFFGRKAELSYLTEMLQRPSTRLITIHGLGGMGKTRLAIELAEQTKSQYPDGSYFIPLVQHQDSPLLAIQGRLGITSTSGKTSLEAVSANLRKKRVLLILDNFEHLTQYARDIRDLLRATNALQIVITSREVLRIQAEILLPLEGLSLDGIGSQSDAYTLFVQRARMSYPDFEADETQQAAIIDICKLVGAMPLAIELAAGWSTILTPQETYQQLVKDLDILVAQETDRPRRHQSIRATFEYSWRNLAPTEQHVLLKMGVFHQDGFTYSAAEAITGANPLIIKKLLDTGLLKHASDKTFACHPLIFQYITERLHADSELYAHTQYQHVTYYLDFVLEHIEALHLKMDIAVLRSFEYEMYNLDRAWFYASQAQRYDWLEAAAEVGYICDLLNLWEQAETLFAKTLKYVPEEERLLRGRLTAFRSIFAYRLGNFDQHRHFAQQSWELLGDSSYIGNAIAARTFLALHYCTTGDTEACFDLLDDLEPYLYDADVSLAAYTRFFLSCARPVATLFIGQPETALPMLQKMPRIDWHMMSLHLPECYMQLERYDDAETELQVIYDASLQAKNYRASLLSIFYLIWMTDQSLVDRAQSILKNFKEIATIHWSVLDIINLVQMLGKSLVLRGQIDMAQVMFWAMLTMTQQEGYTNQLCEMMRHVAEALYPHNPSASKALLTNLIANQSASDETRKRAEQFARENDISFVDAPVDPQVAFVTLLQS